jgi:hypothetical protein
MKIYKDIYYEFKGEERSAPVTFYVQPIDLEVGIVGPYLDDYSIEIDIISDQELLALANEIDKVDVGILISEEMELEEYYFQMKYEEET